MVVYERTESFISRVVSIGARERSAVVNALTVSSSSVSCFAGVPHCSMGARCTISWPPGVKGEVGLGCSVELATNWVELGASFEWVTISVMTLNGCGDGPPSILRRKLFSDFLI